MRRDTNKTQTKKFFALINCHEGEIRSTANELETIEGVREVKKLDDIYDIVVVLESKSEYDSKNILSNKIKTLETIQSTLTLQSCKELQIEIF
ncbi:MAG TPA: Lrp/AsnC family transcriptional regulator [Nitrosopumilaceae archaeon]|nr:Lrp/AsnC family transcriptional regulator [Nitrosopumilaceae archaeon]